MKRITTLQPSSLKGTIFNIPIYNAHNQNYKCENVVEIVKYQYKGYEIIFEAIHSGQPYMIPNSLKLVIQFHLHNADVVDISLYEETQNGSYYNLCGIETDKKNINSIKGLKDTLLRLINLIK